MACTDTYICFLLLDLQHLRDGLFHYVVLNLYTTKLKFERLIAVHFGLDTAVTIPKRSSTR